MRCEKLGTTEPIVMEILDDAPEDSVARQIERLVDGLRLLMATLVHQDTDFEVIAEVVPLAHRSLR